MSLETFADLLEEEMAARSWSSRDVAIRLVMEEFQIEVLALDMLLACRAEPNIIMSTETLDRYAKAFGVSGEFFRNIYVSAAPVTPAPSEEDKTTKESLVRP